MSFIEVVTAVRSLSAPATTRSIGPALQVMRDAGIKYPHYADRTLFLAYGFLRGIPYRVMEPTARPLFDSLGSLGSTLVPDQIAKIVSWADKDHAVTKEAVTAWMAEAEPEAHRAKRLAKEEAARAIRAARRAEHIAKYGAPTQKVA